jgi:peptide deformylase
MLFKKRKYFHVFTKGAAELKQVAVAVPSITQEVVDLGNNLIKIMQVFNGIGLAATQIGVNVRMLALNIPADSEENFCSPGELILLPEMPVVLINPEISPVGTLTGTRDEGCLSVPEIYGPVTRPMNIHLRGQTLDGYVVDCECSGLLARALQHELDHLNGILFVDRMNLDDLAEIQPELQMLESSGASRNYQRKKSG